MSTSKSDGVESTGEREEEDGLIASLADELVWKGDDGDEDEEEDEDGLELESLDAAELESLGISMLVSPKSSICVLSSRFLFVWDSNTNYNYMIE